MMRSDMSSQMRPGMARTKKTVRNAANKVGGYCRPKVDGCGEMKGMKMGRVRSKRGY